MTDRKALTFIIRLATSADILAILDCLAIAFAPYRAEYTPPAFQWTVLAPEAAEERLKDMIVLVAESGAGVIGTLAHAHHGREGHLRGMAVRPECQGQGVANRLLDAAEAALRQQGCERETLDTTLPLKRATRFYERAGYAQSGVIRESSACPSSSTRRI